MATGRGGPAVPRADDERSRLKRFWSAARELPRPLRRKDIHGRVRRPRPFLQENQPRAGRGARLAGAGAGSGRGAGAATGAGAGAATAAGAEVRTIGDAPGMFHCAVQGCPTCTGPEPFGSPPADHGCPTCTRPPELVLELVAGLAAEPAAVVSDGVAPCVAQPAVTTNSAAEAANHLFFI